MAKFSKRSTAAPAFHNTSAYFGAIKNDLREGEGTYIYKNKFFRYQGEWHEGRKHGRGKLLMADGSYYDGDFMDGEIIGNGIRYWASSGNRYEGEFVKGECHGRGRMTYGDGGSYDGEFHLNIREGMGVFVSKNGDIYKGEFHANRKHGEGLQKYSDNSTYDGNWVADFRHGRGLFTFPDGNTYEGQWLGDVMHGDGIYRHRSGYSYNGLWIAGMPAPSCPKTLRISVVGENADGSQWVSSPRNTHEIISGTPINLRITVCDEDGSVVAYESGRKLQVICGIRASKSAPPMESLFGTIEDLTTQQIPTPLGFDIVPYPFSTSNPKVATVTQNQSSIETAQALSVAESVSARGSQSTSHSVSASDVGIAQSSEVNVAVTSTNQCVEELIERGEATLPPLYICPSSENYRVFAALESDVQAIRSAQQQPHQVPSSAASTASSTAAKPRTKTNRPSNEPDIEPTLLFGQPDAATGIRPGRYIFLVRDVTTEPDAACLPDFVGGRLPTTCLVVTVSSPASPQKNAKAK